MPHAAQDITLTVSKYRHLRIRPYLGNSCWLLSGLLGRCRFHRSVPATDDGAHRFSEHGQGFDSPTCRDGLDDEQAAMAIVRRADTTVVDTAVDLRPDGPR